MADENAVIPGKVLPLGYPAPTSRTTAAFLPHLSCSTSGASSARFSTKHHISPTTRHIGTRQTLKGSRQFPMSR